MCRGGGSVKNKCSNYGSVLSCYERGMRVARHRERKANRRETKIF